MRRSAVGLLICALVGAGAGALPVERAAAAPPTTGVVFLTEPFTGTSVTDPNWVAVGDACLSLGNGTGSIPGCDGHTNGPVPAKAGEGFLSWAAS